MNRSVKRIISLLMSAVMAVLMIPVITGNDALAATSAYTGDPKPYTITKTYNDGWYIEPDAPGKYPAVIFVHGSGGPNPIKNNIVKCMNRWISLGYIEPMVVFIPNIRQIKDEQWGIPDFGEFNSDGHCKTLADKIMSGKISSKVDTKARLSICGYSMGGSVALHAGVINPETFVNVGAFSPSWCFYAADQGYIKDQKQIIFSTEPDAHLFIGYGKGEPSEFRSNADRYSDIIKANKTNNTELFKMYTVPADAGEHSWVVFKREFFSFLYFLRYDIIPSDAVVEHACGKGEAPLVNKWKKKDGKWYYYGPDGKKVTGLYEIGKKLYYFDSKGVMKTGRKKAGKYYYYFCSDGYAVKGWKKISGKWYYFAKSNYHMVKGVKKLGGKIYLFADNGVMKTKGWQQDSAGNWYYIRSGGDAVTSSWKTIGNKKYYFGADGIMYAGVTAKIGGKTYKFSKSGALVR